MVSTGEKLNANSTPLTRKERRSFSHEPLERKRSPQLFMSQYLDDLIADGEFDLAERVCEHFFSRHEGFVSDQLFGVAMQRIALPYHRWTQDKEAAPTPSERLHAYETSGNLLILASEYQKSEPYRDRQDKTQGIFTESLFFTTAMRLMATSEHIPLAITPAPLRMDASSAHKSHGHEGVDFLAYYRDLVIPIQIKTGTKQIKKYRPEILVIAMYRLLSSDDYHLDQNQLLAAYDRELATREPDQTANRIQDRLYDMLLQHIDVQHDVLQHNNIALQKQ